MSDALLVINLNPCATTRRGTRALVRAFKRLLSPGCRVLERHFKRVSPAALERIQPRAIVLGPQGVPFDAYPATEKQHLFNLIRSLQPPVLGVCGGHQALVLAHGGSIGPVHGGIAQHSYEGHQKETGFRPVRVNPSVDPLLSDLPENSRFYASHVEGVTTLPHTFELLGRGEACAVQIVRLRDRAHYGVQFHPELGGDGTALLHRFVALSGLSAREATHPPTP